MKFCGKPIFIICVSLVMSACEMTEPVVEKATPNVISISYDAYGSTPTLTAEAIDIAMEHCKSQGGLFANYRGVTVPSALSAKEIHTFACERVKTDDNALIAAQAERYAAESAAAAKAFSDAFNQAQPTYTSCTTFGYQTTCSSY